MKHSLKITIALVALFFVAQIVGLLVTNQHISHRSITPEGTVIIQNETKELAFGTERPETGSPIATLAYIVGAVLFGTILLLVLIRFRQRRVWKIWFYAAVTMCITYSLASFINEYIALACGLIFAYFKIIKPNVIIHNISEVLVYGALGAIFVPMVYMNIYVGIALLAIISIYDMIAVWKSKHMVSLANFQTESKVFAGLMINYSDRPKGNIPQEIRSQPKVSLKKKENKTDIVDEKVAEENDQKSAILGGGDIAFPLIFTGIIMKGLMLNYTTIVAFSLALIVSITSAVALAILLIKAEKGKFYPAMPFISAGCMVGYGIILLITL